MAVKRSKKQRRYDPPIRSFADESVDDWERRMWKKRIPVAATMFAKSISYLATALPELIESVSEGELGGLAKRFDKDVWEFCYRNEEKFLHSIWIRERKSLGPLRELAIFLKLLKRLLKMLSDGDITDEEVCQGMKYLLHDDDFREYMIELPTAMQTKFRSFIDDTVDSDAELIEDTYNQFFLTVWMPCMCLCNSTPGSLFEQAVDGSHEAILKLVRLDRDVQYVEGVSEIISRWERERKRCRSELEALEDARCDSLSGYASSRQYKLAAIESAINCSKEHRKLNKSRTKAFSTRDLRHLFDAIGREQIKKSLINSDLPESDEALRKAMQRKRPVRFSVEGWDKICP